MGPPPGHTQGLLLKCAMHPSFLEAGKDRGDFPGRRFLVFLFGLHPSLVEPLHETIKNQIPLATTKQLK